VKSQTAYERVPPPWLDARHGRGWRAAFQRGRHDAHVPRREHAVCSRRGIRCVRGPATLAVIVYSFEKTAW